MRFGAHRERTIPTSFTVPWRSASLFVAPLVAIAALYWISFAEQFTHLTDAIFANADITSAEHVGALFPQAPTHTTTVLGFMPWYSTLWFELLMTHVPFHRQIWEFGPWLGALLGIGLLTWSTAKVAGRWPAVLVALTLACAGPQLLPILFGWGPLHGGSAAHACVVGWFLVLLVERGGWVGGRVAHVLVCALVAAFTAAGVASDPVVIPAALVPFVLAGLLVAVRSAPDVRLAIACSVAGIGAGAAVGARLITTAMEARHVRGESLTIHLATWNALGTNIRQLVSSLAYLFNGDLAGAALDGRSLLALACAIVIVAAIAVVVGASRDLATRLARPVTTRAELVCAAHIAFWLFASVLSASAFVFSSEADAHAGRYLLAAAFGLPTLVAVHAATKPVLYRGAVVAGACVLIAASAVAVGAGDLGKDPAPPAPAFAHKLESVAEGEGLKYGYASYWNAAPLSWDMHERVQLYPLESCGAAGGMCINSFHRIDSWYGPRPRTRTFLLVDRIYGPANPGSSLGAPVEVIDLDRYEIVVYDHDIGPELGPPTTPPA